MIEFKNVSKSYRINSKNKVNALNDVSFRLPNKGMIFIIGTSGSGKTTLLNLLGMLDKPNSGDIIIDNKIICKFKQREIDYYRNTYVGFVFQEYNLLDNFNVGKNIEIALNLQKKKNNQEQVDEVLKKIGLENLKNRKIKELSGGQKQRVAIGRAIIKNPNMILADEPTGNLDSTNSDQIFGLLKDISKEKLVVVVTHDTEFANKYGDRIIEIKDGKIENDNVKKELEYTPKTFSLVKSKLSFLNSIYLSVSNLKKKKLKLCIITLLLTLSLSMFGFFAQLIKFDVNRTHAETLIKQKEFQVEINKKVVGKKFTTASPIITFTNEEINEVQKKLNKEISKVSKAVENNDYLEISFASEANQNISDTKNYAYYELSPSYTLFLEYNQKQINNLQLIGKIPSGNKEIIINKVFADYIIKNGLLVWTSDKDGKVKEENYFPKSYEEIVGDNKKIVYGSSYLIISGIVDEDMSKYDALKTTLSDDMLIEPTDLYKEFKIKYESKLSEVIVLEHFFDNLDLSPNNVVPIDFYKLSYNFEGNKIYPTTNTAIINKKIKMYDGDKLVEIEKLNNNEVVLGTAMLDELYDNEYSTKLLELIQIEKTNYEQRIKLREEKLKEIEKNLELNPEYDYEYPKEIEELDINKIMTDFTYKYINEKGIIGKKFSIEINDLYLRKQKDKTKLYEDFIIVGYSSEEVYNYFSSESVLSVYMREKSETISISFEEKNQIKLEEVFNNFPSNNSKYVSKTLYSSTISTVEKVVDKISKIALYFAVFALFFSIVLFIYFTISSVNSNKKSIGILRSLGAKTGDIYKIFYLESFLMGIFAVILSSAMCYYSVIIANQLISSNLFINVSPIIFRPEILIILIILLVILNTISFIIPVFKITKTKPIDIINAK